MKLNVHAAICILLALISSALAAGGADTRPTTNPSPEVVALVNAGGDDKLAISKLADMGDDAEPSLKMLLSTQLSPEARARAEAALAAIDEKIQGGSIITLRFTDKPLQDALVEFARQSHADLGVDRAEIVEFCKDKSITLDLDHVNFWTALSQISDKSGLVLQPRRMTFQIGSANGNGNGIDLQSPRAIVAGPFLVVPDAAFLQGTVQYGKGGASATSVLTLRFKFIVEPRLHVLGTLDHNWITEAVDDKGHVLPCHPQDPPPYFNQGRVWSWMLQPEFTAAPDTGEKLARLKGNIKATVQTASSSLHINDLTQKDASQSLNGMKITLHKMTTQPSVTTLDLSMEAPPSAMADGGQSLLWALDVYDKQNRVLERTNMTYKVTGNVMDLTLPFYGDQHPDHLIWELPTETRKISIPVEIDDLPLPSRIPTK